MARYSDKDFASPADYDDGFVESDMARGERMLGREARRRAMASERQVAAKAGEDGTLLDEIRKVDGNVVHEIINGKDDGMLAEAKKVDDDAVRAIVGTVDDSLIDVIMKGTARLNDGGGSSQDIDALLEGKGESSSETVCNPISGKPRPSEILKRLAVEREAADAHGRSLDDGPALP